MPTVRSPQPPQPQALIREFEIPTLLEQLDKARRGTSETVGDYSGWEDALRDHGGIDWELAQRAAMEVFQLIEDATQHPTRDARTIAIKQATDEFRIRMR
jgi:hypothetical protein